MNNQTKYNNDEGCYSIDKKISMGTSEATEESKNKKRNGSKESELTYLIQGKSEISQHWFNLDTDWIEDNFMTR